MVADVPRAMGPREEVPMYSALTANQVKGRRFTGMDPTGGRGEDDQVLMLKA